MEQNAKLSNINQLLGCVYTYPDRSGYPDISAPDRPSVYTKTIEVYAIRRNTLRYPELCGFLRLESGFFLLQ